MLLAGRVCVCLAKHIINHCIVVAWTPWVTWNLVNTRGADIVSPLDVVIVVVLPPHAPASCVRMNYMILHVIGRRAEHVAVALNVEVNT